MRILVCDDSLFMRNILIKIIGTIPGFEVVGEASNGKEASDKFRILKPDIVTMDITMPDVDGLQGLKRITDFDSSAYVIMVSAMGQQAMVIEAVQAGSKDFIVKPFTTERVTDALMKAHYVISARG